MLAETGWLGVDWQAVEAVGTVSAFIGGAVALCIEVRRHGKQERRFAEEVEARAEDVRRRQASKVSIVPITPTSQGPSERRYQQLAVKNDSAAQVVDVSVVIRHDDKEETIDTLAVLEPHGEKVYSPATNLQVQPGRGPETLIVRFVDVDGRRWERDGRGRLSPLK